MTNISLVKNLHEQALHYQGKLPSNNKPYNKNNTLHMTRKKLLTNPYSYSNKSYMTKLNSPTVLTQT